MVDIVSISIYTSNQRVKLTPDSYGEFLIPRYPSGSSSSPLLRVTAVQLVTHAKIKHMDPVLTLSDGSKLRVYQGGDPSGMIVLAISLCEKHDNKHKKKIPAVPKSKKIPKRLDAPYHGGYCSGASIVDYPWDDPSFYDDPD